jgi:hypothetical protein
MTTDARHARTGRDILLKNDEGGYQRFELQLDKRCIS